MRDEKMKIEAGKIDVTPTWMGVYPLFCQYIDEGTPEQKQFVKDELKKLSKFVDEARKEIEEEEK